MSTESVDAQIGEPAPARGYPVIDSAELNPVTPRRFHRAKRALHEIPRQLPGSVLVFQLGNSYEALNEGAVRLDDRTVVDAVAVAVVSTRQTQCEVETQLANNDPRTCISLRASFFCQVHDPELVLDFGCWNVIPMLVDHINADRRLRFMALAADLHREWVHFQRNATAQLFAYHDMHPLIVPGLTVRLTDLALGLARLAASPQPSPRFEQSSATAPPSDGRPSAFAATGRDRDQAPGVDGNPDFMPDNYSWGDKE